MLNHARLLLRIGKKRGGDGDVGVIVGGDGDGDEGRGGLMRDRLLSSSI